MSGYTTITTAAVAVAAGALHCQQWEPHARGWATTLVVHRPHLSRRHHRHCYVPPNHCRRPLWSSNVHFDEQWRSGANTVQQLISLQASSSSRLKPTCCTHYGDTMMTHDPASSNLLLTNRVHSLQTHTFLSRAISRI